ncbi:hypothetical protein Sjap_021190 [Stephania japonica]|uniref:15-cis-phytoene synthase n=1 Tax=Stephania japonica TaxID=461633 RepID=A0AAP0I0W6_9MAGN
MSGSWVMSGFIKTVHCWCSCQKSPTGAAMPSDTVTWGTIGDLTIFMMASHSPRSVLTNGGECELSIFHVLVFISCSGFLVRVWWVSKLVEGFFGVPMTVKTFPRRKQHQRGSMLAGTWRTDELVDGPNASHITPTALDRWEARLEDVFQGCPYDMPDAALSDTINKFPVDIEPFKDIIEGMRMDLQKSRYMNFDELYLYCYYAPGTAGLMSVPVMGILPESKASTESVYNAALAFGISNLLTNILRDVGQVLDLAFHDSELCIFARRGRVYLPQDELAKAGLSYEDIFAGKVIDKWRIFMKSQIKRARMFFDQADRERRDRAQRGK